MEAFLGLFALVLVAAVVAGPVLALVALARAARLERELQEMRRSFEHAPVAPTPSAPMPAPVVTTPARMPGTAPLAAAPPPVAAPPAVSAMPPSPPAAPVAARTSDFATNLGPKLLVAAGGLAVVVFLGFFVRYAWENNWVGPTGRVLSASVFSLALVAVGLRIIHREYRPLGQGLTAAGLAGLYVTAFAAHAVYDLLPRSLAAVFMVVVTACAVALAERLDARLLAALAWAGGYLAPVLLATSEDRAVSLFAYLLLLGGGAVWLDRRRPWLETLPLALTGSALLYGGWFAAHFRPERFGVASGGLLLLTALFALGAGTKQRTGALALVALLATVGLSALGLAADQPLVLLVAALALAAALLRAPLAGRSGLALLAPVVLGLPLVSWAAAHYRPDAFGIAAAWIAAASLLLVVAAPEGEAAIALCGTALVVGGFGSVLLASASDRPHELTALLAAQAALALLARRRWAWAEAAGALLAGLAVLAWFAAFFAAPRSADALVLALATAGIYFLIVTVRGLAVAQPLDAAGAATHVVAAALAWAALYRVLNATTTALLGPAAVALAVVHLAVGLAALRRASDALRTRLTLGLAASFLTIAIPVQLGLHGITLGWAAEGVLLLWLGVRQRSFLGRAFGYGVLALAVGRLLYRHLPLHPGAFAPVLNPAFGVWLAVIAALLAAQLLLRRALAATADERRERLVDEVASALLVPVALSLLFAALTMETQQSFAQLARSAAAANDAAAAQSAGLQSDLAVSVLWTLFATGLLAAGLALRSRGLFYAAYALFAVTAGKVVLADLATLPTLYRMLSFLALGVLLLAGAWLNLRFRERLALPAAAS